MKPVHVIGIGQGKRDLTLAHVDLINGCELLIGGQRHLDLFPEYSGETFVIKADLNAVTKLIKSEMKEKKVVVLASGDPMFYGIGTTLSKSLSKEHLVIHPNISSVAAAFSIIGHPWHDARIVSLHSRNLKPFKFSELSGEVKAAFLTSPEKDPAYITKKLTSNGLHDFKVCVLECLGDSDNEKVSWFDDYNELLNTEFNHPNIVILIKSPKETKIVPHETHIGMSDDTYKHSQGLITKSEIRALAISKLQLTGKDHIVWDVGSGSGSVGIEVATLVPWGLVYAIEKNKQRISDIIHNVKNFSLPNVRVLNQDFPDDHEALGNPDRIFIGGGGKDIENIIDVCCTRIKEQGVIVINTVVLQTMDAAIAALNKNGFDPQMIQVQISRSKPMPYGNRMDALNPVWIISGTKPQAN
ncbi:MAG: precorrin-6y C5,15-methyltransferase (decarboxylating) subunit CbiE [Desulfobacterales bacterium]|nr:precorrin-6y C5,15-methyltransferase (decarboxylating) subunit CbiE [Desulfobacterales bacterium]